MPRRWTHIVNNQKRIQESLSSLLNQISDIEYFHRKLSAGLHVPLEPTVVEPIVFEPTNSLFYLAYEPDLAFISEEGMEFYSLPELNFF
jgi:hypothetical protein